MSDRISYHSSGALYSINSKGSYFHFCNPICPLLSCLRWAHTFYVAAKSCYRLGMVWDRGSTSHLIFLAIQCSKQFQAKLVLCSLAREVSSALGCGSFRCASTSLTFSSLTLMSLLFLKLFYTVFFHCYAAIIFPAMRGPHGKYQQLIVYFFLLNVSNCL